MCSNYIRVKCKNDHMYQYAVSFNPEIDSKNMRYKLIAGLREVIGPVKAFDGMILYLPIKLPLQVSKSGQVWGHTQTPGPPCPYPSDRTPPDETMKRVNAPSA